MNVYDSERMAELLTPLGYRAVGSAETADLIILNTCHIREKATEKVFSELGRLREMKAEQARDVTIAVAGCVAQAEGAEILQRAPVVDFVIGPQSYHQLPELLARASRARGERLAADFTPQEKFDALPKTRAAHGASAFLSVQEGCDKFCTFCVVPYTRGAEYSRPMAAIEAEARVLADQGVRELTLLGQNVNAYHDGALGLADLIARLARIDGIARLRYTTSHPLEMSDDLIALHGSESKLMPFLHLPVQSGSDRILKAMNRKHTADDYRVTIAKLRAARPDIALSTDIIVGFPGERDEDFEATMAMVREIGFASSFSFQYSRRPGTPAAAMKGQVAEDAKRARLQALQAELNTQQRDFNARQIGQTLPVLIDGKGRMPGQMHGRTPYLQAAHFDGDLPVGAIAHMRVVGASLSSVAGMLVS